VDGLSVGVEEIFLKYSPEEIRDHNIGLQELALEKLDHDKYQAVVHPAKSRSGILALIPKLSDASTITAELEKQNIVMTPRDGYIRFAPHLCTTEDEIIAAVDALNKV